MPFQNGTGQYFGVNLEWIQIDLPGKEAQASCCGVNLAFAAFWVVVFLGDWFRLRGNRAGWDRGSIAADLQDDFSLVVALQALLECSAGLREREDAGDFDAELAGVDEGCHF